MQLGFSQAAFSIIYNMYARVREKSIFGAGVFAALQRAANRLVFFFRVHKVHPRLCFLFHKRQTVLHDHHKNKKDKRATDADQSVEKAQEDSEQNGSEQTNNRKNAKDDLENCSDFHITPSIKFS